MTQGSTSPLSGQIALQSTTDTDVRVTLGGDLAGSTSTDAPSIVYVAAGQHTYTEFAFGINPTGLSQGTYTVTITFTDVNVPADQVTYTITVGVL